MEHQRRHPGSFLITKEIIMPLVIPHKSESRTQFIARFMSDESMVKEYPKADQRYAVANQKWKERMKTNTMDPMLPAAKI